MAVDDLGPLMTPRRQRDLARQQAPVDPPPTPPVDDASGPMLSCPQCGASLSLKAVSAGGPGPAAPPAPPSGGSPFGS